MSSLFLRHEFLIRRLHSLSGLVPIGAYMTVHLLTNASLLVGPGKFQSLVNQIHALPALPAIEWLFIFLPLIFHTVVGIWIAQTGQPNSMVYGYANNVRYTWQRYTGYIAMIFIFAHVFHLHGWFHFDWWLKGVAEPLGMAQFRPYNAASTLAVALQGVVWPVLYAIGVLACCYHLANGIWTAGITWGVWVSKKGQERATKLCAAFGLFIAVLGMSALFAAKTTDPENAIAEENRIYEAGIASGAIKANPHKRSAQGEQTEASTK